MSSEAGSRRRILDATLACARARPDFSMAEVAAGAGVSRQAVYLHFPDRAALLATLASRARSAGRPRDRRAGAQRPRRPHLCPDPAGRDLCADLAGAAGVREQPRRHGRLPLCQALVARFRTEGALAPHLSPATAADILYSLTSPALWHELVEAGVGMPPAIAPTWPSWRSARSPSSLQRGFFGGYLGMLRTILLSLAALVMVAAIVGGIVLGAKSVTVGVTQEHYQACLDSAEANHEPPINCPKTESLWDRGFDDPVAYYTFWLALFTIALALGALVQSVLIGRQITLAREEFLSTHRPKIRLRHLRMEDFTAGQEVAISLRASNIGDGPATLIGVDIDFEVRGAIPRNPNNAMLGADPAKFASSFARSDRIAAGSTAFISIRMPWIYAQGWYNPANMKSAIQISGKILYRDDAGIRRETAFYRTCTGDLNRFHMVSWNNEAQQRDFEYERLTPERPVMTPAARLQMAIEILEGLETTAQPTDRFLKGLVSHPPLCRLRATAAPSPNGCSPCSAIAPRLAHRMGDDAPRALMIAALLEERRGYRGAVHRRLWPRAADRCRTRRHRGHAARPRRDWVRGEYPQWLEGELQARLRRPAAGRDGSASSAAPPPICGSTP